MKKFKRLIAVFLIAALLSSCKSNKEHECSFELTETIVAASCTEGGELAKKCSVCGKSETFVLAPTSHVLSDWTKTGLFDYVKTCTLCGEIVASEKIDDVYSKGLEYERGLRDSDLTLVGIGGCTDSVIVIPPKLNGTPVTVIGRYAFADCKNITAVIIPDTVTVIEDNAFGGSSIKRIFISDSVIRIGSKAFNKCKQLTEIILPNSLTYLGGYVFSDTPSLKEIIIPQSLTSLSDYAFANSSITTLALPAGITKIGTGTFKDCKKLTSLSLPDTLNEIGSNAFDGCTALTDAVLPDSITFIGEAAFAECSSLKTVIVPTGLSTISAQVFKDCYSLGKVYLHDKLKSIHGTSFLGVDIKSVEFLIPSGNDYLYKNGSSLIGRDPNAITLGSLLIKSVPDTVIIGSADGSIPTDPKIKKIGACAFQDRRDLTHIVIPKNITSIGGGAFHGCPNIVSISYEGTVAEWKEVSLGVKWYSGYQVATVRCSDGEAKIEFD